MRNRILETCLALVLLAAMGPTWGSAQEPAVEVVPPAATNVPLVNLEGLIARVQPSIVVIRFAGRNGETQGVGSGFIIGADGLIATNLHVLGEARPITVELLDGSRHEVKSIHAHERSQDLAIIKIDAHDLPVLELGDSGALTQGQPLVAFGNPQGLAHSVVTGIVSGLREEIEGMPMIQLAIPIEPGNSGGPVVDLEGRVFGLLTLKSLVTDNLGYAVTINALKPLLEKPNPLAMSRWLTIGTLNPSYWQSPDDGVHWTQRAGHIRAEGTGAGFGGRSLCLSMTPEPASRFEAAVWVRMEEEDGAAGLVLHADDGQRHYGFYPSSGRLRFSRFDGPTVFEWHVLREAASPHYRPGEWNRIKVRVEPGRIECFCNEEVVFEINDDAYTGGRVGLVKFRHTTAEFKQFRVGESLPAERASPEEVARITELVRDIATDQPPPRDLVRDVGARGALARSVLEDRARLLEQQAQRLRQLSREAHARETRDRLRATFSRKGGNNDLVHAALLVAALDNAELDIDFYLQVMEDLASACAATVPESAAPEQRVAALHEFLFEEQGFHGSRTSYYDASNSYLNEVLDDREGLPISLSIIYLKIARRIGLDAEGVGLPGHFAVLVRLEEGLPELIDVFDRGRSMSLREVQALVPDREIDWSDDILRRQTEPEIITRMLRNLLNLANNASDPESALRYVDTLLALDPESVQDRLFKAVLCYNTRRAEEGLAEVDWILERQPEGLVMERVYELQSALQRLP